jgi:phosphoglycolate phosphatase-like HAD superfamily hydrolase
MTEQVSPLAATGLETTDIRAVIFDIDGVLMDSKAANVTWYREFLARHGYTDLAPEDLARGHYYSLREAIAFLTQADESTVDAILEDARELAGYPYELVTLPTGCVEVIEGLADRYGLGIVTSRISEGIDQFMRFSQLPPERFGAIVGYEDSTHHKPHAEPLLVACARLGIHPNSAVYVGDAASDMACARAAGTHFIAFGDAIPDADLTITCFDELDAAISGLGR